MMNVTPDVVIDLLTLVLSDQASEDSKALVASYLEKDPNLATIAKARASRFSSEGVPAPLGKEIEMKSLQRTRRALTWRGALVGVGVFFALAPLSFSFGSNRPRWLLLESPPSVAISAGIALLAWGGYFWLRRRLRARAS